MFAIVKDNTVQQIIQEGSQFTVDGVTYANNWFQLATQEEKTALGVMEVVYGARPDDKYYWVTESAPTVNGNVVDINFTSTPKDLAGLKANATSAIDQQAFSLLSPTDYMSIKALETGTAMAETIALAKVVNLVIIVKYSSYRLFNFDLQRKQEELTDIDLSLIHI